MLDSKYLQWLKWFFILAKRLLKKPSFIIILALIPITSIFISLTGSDKGGFIKIALSYRGEQNPYTDAVISEIAKGSDILSVTVFEDADAAIEEVRSSRADAAWVLEENLQEKIKQFALGNREVLVEVTAAEDGMSIRSSREKLFGYLFSEISYELYSHFIKTELPNGEDFSEHRLREVYDEFFGNESIVQFVFLNSEEMDIKDMNYITTPLRGISAIVMLLCALASTMYFKNDESNKIFSVLSPIKRLFVMLGGNIAALIFASVFMTASLILSDSYTSFWEEGISMLIYIPTCAVFAALLGSIFRSNNMLGAMIPIIIVLSLVLSPIFFNLHSLPLLQSLIPPYYYLYSITDTEFLIKNLIFLAAISALTSLIYCQSCKKGRF